MSSVACHRSCKGTPSSPLKTSKKPRPIFLLPFTLNIISLNINIETIIHPDIIHIPSYIYIKGIYIIRYIIINSQSRHYIPHTTSRNGLFRFMFIIYLSKSSCRFALLLPVGQWVYDRSRVLTVYPCSRTFCPKNATGFVAQRSRLHWHLKQASLPNEASFIFSGCFLDMIISVGFRVNSHQGGFLQVIGLS